MYLYLETKPNSNTFNCRGMVGAKDDPYSFARMVGEKGLRVVVTRKHAGDRDVLLSQLDSPAIGTAVTPPRIVTVPPEYKPHKPSWWTRLMGG